MLAMPRIVAHLFGGMELRDAEGHELSVDSRKARAILAILIVESGRWHARERLAGLLWGERGETQARNSLNQALYELHKLEIETDLEIIERETDRLRVKAGSVDCDVHRFEGFLTSDPMAAAELYTGRLLDGLDLAEREFTDWRNQTRAEHLEARARRLREGRA